MDDETPAEHILPLEERRRLERLAVEEAGGGESEGFELAEQELIEHASHGDDHTPARIIRDAGPRRSRPPRSTEKPTRRACPTSRRALPERSSSRS